jgi:hypothetical protein
LTENRRQKTTGRGSEQNCCQELFEKKIILVSFSQKNGGVFVLFCQAENMNKILSG